MSFDPEGYLPNEYFYILLFGVIPLFIGLVLWITWRLP